MSSRFVRATLLLYPHRWRRRYGGELEQLLMDTAEFTSPLGSARLLVGVAASGLAERLQRYSTGLRVFLVVCLCAVIGVLVDVNTTSRTGGPDVTLSPIGKFDLGPGTVLRADVTLVPWLPLRDPRSHKIISIDSTDHMPK